MMRNIASTLVVFLIVFCVACTSTNPNYQAETNTPEFLHRSMEELTRVIVHDIFSPPVASRNYVYPSIAAYEVARQMEPQYKSMAGQLNGLSAIPSPDANQEYNFPLAATMAFLGTAKAFIFSEAKITAFQEQMLKEFESIRMPKAVFQRSVDYGHQVAQHILSWADQDNYKQSRSFPKFTITEDPERWKPTPPAYMEGIEPHWREIRPLVLDSAQQFQPELPTQFDLSKDAPFYKEVVEVYEAVKTAKEEERVIASFWDCNPYVMNVTGHVMHASKKITPGGHWMGIAKIACQKSEASFARSAAAYLMTSIALFDGFISCWDEKYRSNLIRPETIINEHIDPSWVPLLQTPPFPEYTSGHSVISSASAVALTSLFGDQFAFVDSTEVDYGLPARSFGSFLEASDEAAISRLYGGIHYRPAIENGVTQGKRLGAYILENVKTN
ncbi:MAG: vanadium-dependent haloperoxidase [Bacteroidota bacterium]